MKWDWKWNGNKWQSSRGNKVEWSEMETERKWNGESMANSDINIWFWKWYGMEVEMETEPTIIRKEFLHGDF